jgi:hypothetical protein
VEYQDAVNKLWNHANLPEKGLRPKDSFVYTAWHAEKTKSPQEFQPLYEDILSCLAVVNSSLNGPIPSESVVSSPPPVDRTLCYCMSGILSAGWSHYFQWRRRKLFDAEFIDGFASMLVRIGIVWDQVLAGDIDDIVADAEREFAIEQT